MDSGLHAAVFWNFKADKKLDCRSHMGRNNESVILPE